MSFAGAGSFISAAASSFTLTPSGTGHVIVLFVASNGSAATALSSSNVTWSVLVAGTAVGSEQFTVFKGVVTTASAATVTVTVSGSPTLRIGGHEYSTTAGAASVALYTSGTLNATGTGWPSLTALAGQLYAGFEFNSGTAVSGSTSGYTYGADANGNGIAFNPGTGAGATSPVWGDSDARSVMAVLLLEAVPLPAAAQVTAAGHPLALPAPVPAAAQVTAAGYALKPPGIPLPAAAAVTSAGYTPVPPAVVPRAQVTAAGFPLVPPDRGYPDGALGARVELLLGSTWTDLTTAALPDGRQYGTITGGQPDGAQQPAPAKLAAVWDNPDYSLSPRNSSGPYYGLLRQNTPARVSFTSPYGTYLRLEADSSDRAFVSDITALHVTGSMELRAGLILSDWRACVLAARYDNTLPSWYWLLNANGTLTFAWYDSGGTQHSVTSPAAAGVSWKAFRVTLDATNGNVQFFLSGDIDGTWTSMGAASSGTSGAATTVRAGNAPLVVGWSANIAGQVCGQVQGFRLYNGIGGSVVADAAFSSQVPGVTTWTDLAGVTWLLAGGAEISARDYRLHGELSTLNPAVAPSGAAPQLQATLSGRLRRLQQGSAPTVDSAMRRAVLSQTGSLYPVDYWTMEDGGSARSFGPAVGSSLLTVTTGTVKPAADTSFEASAALPLLNGAGLVASVDTYTGATAWAVRFLFKRGATLPASGSVRLIEVTSGGACPTVRVTVNPDGTLNFTGLLSGGATAFSFTELAYPQLPGPAWWSVEATTSGSGVQYALVAIAPGAGSGNTQASTVTGHGSFGNVTAVAVNPDLILTDSVFGHLSVQKAWTSMFSLGAPLNAWRTELAADRFARVCAEQGIPCRILGRPATTQAMGPQPRGSAWTILRDCEQTEQGIVFEPRDCFGLGLRTRESMAAQSGVTLSFSAANLQGDLQPADDDQGFLNDVTGSMPDGTSWREVLDDGSAKSVSEPKDGGMGRYAGAVPFSINIADASGLGSNVAFYLGRTSVNAARYRNVVMDLGIPGAPAADIARLRPGDTVSVPSPPGIYQTADISQLAMGWTETFGPGRRITWDCVPASPYI